MDYPSGDWKHCEDCGSSYFRYDDGVGSCSNSECPPRVAARKERIRQEKRDRKIKQLEKENEKLRKGTKDE